MRIWVDLANSPQVLFFQPIIAELERSGHTVLVTSRHYAQTVALADRVGLRHTPIGSHTDRRWVNMVQGSVGRAIGLVGWAKKQRQIDLAVSHNAYAQALAARWLRLPFVTLMDYEHQPANHACFRLARRVVVPEAFPEEDIRRYGAAGKTVRYRGLKEQVYLSGFTPSPGFLREQGIPDDKVVVVMRPPAPWTAYHRFENTVFDQVLSSLAGRSDTFVVFLPRIPVQGEMVKTLGYQNVWVPPRALDGPNLLYGADLAISGGGTMNREAAVLGTPAYTVFKGKLGAVDRYLMERGRMEQISEPEDIKTIEVVKRNGHRDPMFSSGLIQLIAGRIVSAV